MEILQFFIYLIVGDNLKSQVGKCYNYIWFLTKYLTVVNHWASAGIGRQAGLKNLWYESTVRVQLPPRPLFMLLILYLLLFLIFLIIIIFSFPKFSPIPYFPTAKKDLPLIIKALGLKNNQVIIDLGAGDGRVIFAAANEAFQKRLTTFFFAIEINPILIFIMNLRRLLHPNKKNIKIIWGDIFKIDKIKELNFNSSLNVNSRSFKLTSLTFYLYLSPWFLETIVKKIKNYQLKVKNLSLVSYLYPIKNLKEQEKIIKGKRHNVFVYKIKV